MVGVRRGLTVVRTGVHRGSGITCHDMNDTQHAAVWLSHNATYVVMIGAMCGVDEWLPPPSDAESLSDTDGGEREILEAEALVVDDDIFGDMLEGHQIYHLR